MHNEGEERLRIAEAYAKAQDTIAAIALDDNGSPRPRILACFRQFDVLNAADDVAAAGWMLTAFAAARAKVSLAGIRNLMKSRLHEVVVFKTAAGDGQATVPFVVIKPPAKRNV